MLLQVYIYISILIGIYINTHTSIAPCKSEFVLYIYLTSLYKGRFGLFFDKVIFIYIIIVIFFKLNVYIMALVFYQFVIPWV